MARSQSIDNEFSARFFNDILQLYPLSSRQYRCTDISDIHYCQLGVLRCLSSSTSGQEFLQFHVDQGQADIAPSHFFKALKSRRRLANITSLNDLLADPMKHYHKAACFDPKSKNAKGELRAIATGHFFRMNLRTHHMSCLGMANPEDGKKKAHDMTVIKRSSADQLRNGAGKGRKVMLVWDKACIDYHHWHKLKHTYGIYFVTLEKSNSAAAIVGVNEFDRADPKNDGIVSDHLVGTSNGVMLRRIIYINPEDGVSYTYLTNDNTLPACQIVLLYKHRWDIEKIFHQFKSKMGERKSWASSLAAKQSHAIFECLAHNLLLLFEKHIGHSEGLHDETESEKQEGRTKGPAGIIRALGNFINTAVQRATQRTQRFIRWVRVWIYRQTPWGDSTARLRQVWAGKTT